MCLKSARGGGRFVMDWKPPKRCAKSCLGFFYSRDENPKLFLLAAFDSYLLLL